MSHATKPARAAGLTGALIVPSRFCGPPGSGNGGYVCGRIAAYLDGPATVTLRRPCPLGTPMTVERDGDRRVRVHHGSTLIAEAASSPDGPAPPVPGPVSLTEAQAVAGSAGYYTDPVFPGCFVCGTGRGPGDGLRIFPGPLPARPLPAGPLPAGPLWAAPWMPDPSVTDATGRVRPEVVWAALDCPSGIAAAEAARLTRDTVILLGRMTASLHEPPPAAGDPCVVIAWPGERDGRKLLASSALLGRDGEVLAAASTVWLTVPPPAAGGAS
jgi:hypothetical protein